MGRQKMEDHVLREGACPILEGWGEAESSIRHLGSSMNKGANKRHLFSPSVSDEELKPVSLSRPEKAKTPYPNWGRGAGGG